MNSLILSSLFIIPALLFSLSNFRSISLRKSYDLIQFGLYTAIILGLGAMVWTHFNEPIHASLIQYADFGLTIRLDALSSLMYTMIGIIGLVVVRYSRNYLDGEKRHKQFIARLATTIAFVQLLVISGNLAIFFISWVGTSMGLHQLLLFYPERKKARLAAHKKFIIARMGDLTLLSAFILIYLQLGTADLSQIFEQVQNLSRETLPFQLELAGILLVASACLKSVQIPFHGWLLDVMETPTPVSALLHAGLLNAGPFLILRFAYLIDLTSTATIILIIIGGLSALFGAIIAISQPSIKTSLAYSSIGHMGFTLLVCGLGVYAASLLHLVAHSFYKAHSFLSSGSLIEKVQTSGADHYKRSYRIGRIILALITSVVLYLGVTSFWQNSMEMEFQLSVISGIIFLGILSLHINTLDSTNGGRSIIYLIVGSLLVVNCFYLFEHAFAFLLKNQIPSIRTLSETDKGIVLGLMILFTLTVLSQSMFSQFANSLFFRRMEIHFRNGLYLNHILNRFMNSLTLKPIK
ncbi:NADH/ubiquinone/plastoquinone (complex i) [Algoriphagus kandeliae]|uniref:Probable inorganic carbon transporter subunit DabB n=1 Tax=Algoriphagus kandeliae TaxID=2562278 RepID=A0A4Y9QUB7_9BACT|nr:proton-conducting transporter membrane subunit [Algoriphagus kandeliae]TFV95660.1 NADH/ubiquinone/plastoquinone (complex i) [Algoriphagus kandeliae]